MFPPASLSGEGFGRLLATPWCDRPDAARVVAQIRRDVIDPIVDEQPAAGRRGVRCDLGRRIGKGAVAGLAGGAVGRCVAVVGMGAFSAPDVQPMVMTAIVTRSALMASLTSHFICMPVSRNGIRLRGNLPGAAAVGSTCIIWSHSTIDGP